MGLVDVRAVGEVFAMHGAMQVTRVGVLEVTCREKSQEMGLSAELA